MKFQLLLQEKEKFPTFVSADWLYLWKQLPILKFWHVFIHISSRRKEPILQNFENIIFTFSSDYLDDLLINKSYEYIFPHLCTSQLVEMEFVIDNFAIADIYNHVEVVGPRETGHLIFKKSEVLLNRERKIIAFENLTYLSKFHNLIFYLYFIRFCKVIYVSMPREIILKVSFVIQIISSMRLHSMFYQLLASYMKLSPKKRIIQRWYHLPYSGNTLLWITTSNSKQNGRHVTSLYPRYTTSDSVLESDIVFFSFSSCSSQSRELSNFIDE